MSALARSRRALEVTSIVVLLISGSIAHAAPPKPPKPTPKTAPKPPPPPVAPATKTYDEAVALSAAGNHEAALAIFRKLTVIEARRGAAEALDKLGRADEAVADYEAYIAGAPSSADDRVRAARARVAELKATKTSKVRVVTVPPGAVIEVAGQPASRSPVDLDLPAGKHLVRASVSGGEPVTREVEVVAGAPLQEVKLDLAATPSATPIARARPVDAPTTPGPAPADGIDRLGAPIVTGALGALSLGAGIYFGLSALQKKSSYDDNPTESRLASAETAAALSTAGLVGGVVLGAVTVVLFLTTPAATDGPSKAAIRANGLQLRF